MPAFDWKIRRDGSAFGEILDLGDQIGSGAYGTVFCAIDNKSAKYAVKLFGYDGKGGCVSADEFDELYRSAETEYEVLLALERSEHVPSVHALGAYQVDEDESYPALVQDYVEGETLSKVVEKGVLTGSRDIPLNADLTARVVLGIAKALELPAIKKIAHRDLSPNNIVLTNITAEVDQDGAFSVTLLDFGQSATRHMNITPKSGSPRLTTYQYGAPEVYGGRYYESWRKDPMVDVWSIGPLITYMMTKEHFLPHGFPSIGGNYPTEEEREAIAQAKSKPISLLNVLGQPDGQDPIISTLDDIVSKCTSFVPRDRPDPDELEGQLNMFFAPPRTKQRPPARTTPVQNGKQVDPYFISYLESGKGSVGSNPSDNRVDCPSQAKPVDADLKHSQEENPESESPLERKPHSKRHDSRDPQSAATDQRSANRVARIAMRTVITVAAIALAAACWLNADEIASRTFSPETSAYLADAYLHGHGSRGQNLNYALECYERAAGQGDKDSAYMAGYLHWIGPGAWQDWNKAKGFFEQAGADTSFLDGADDPDGADETVLIERYDVTRDFLGDNSTGLVLIKTNSGDVAYSTSLSDKFPSTDMSYTISSRYDYGLQYIMSNGYPCVTYRNNVGMDSVITQDAIWMYLNPDNIAFDLRNQTRADEYELLPIINDLASEASKQEGLSYYGMKRHAAELIGMKGGIATLKFNEAEHRYETELIDAGPTDHAYKVSCSNESVRFVDEAGRERASYSAGERFKIIVPENKYANEEYYGITLTALTDLDVARIYQSDEEGYEDIAVMSRGQRSVSSTIMAIAPSAPVKRPLAPLAVGAVAAILCFTALGFAWKRLTKQKGSPRTKQQNRENA